MIKLQESTLAVLKELGYTGMTPVQAACIPLLLSKLSFFLLLLFFFFFLSFLFRNRRVFITLVEHPVIVVTVVIIAAAVVAVAVTAAAAGFFCCSPYTYTVENVYSTPSKMLVLPNTCLPFLS